MLTIERTDQCNEIPVASKRRRALKVLGILIAVIAALVLCTLLFTLFDTVSPSDGERAAYAWSFPTNTTGTGPSLDAGNVDDTNVQYVGTSSLSNAFLANDGWNMFANKSINNASISSNGTFNEPDDSHDFGNIYVLVYKDIVLTEAERAAIVTGNLTSITVNITLRKTGNDFWRHSGDVTTTLFLVQGYGTAQSGSDNLDSFTNINESGSNNYAAFATDWWKTGGVQTQFKSPNAELTISLCPGAARIRFGVLYYINKSAGNSSFQSGGMICNSDSCSYVSYSPKLTVSSAGNGGVFLSDKAAEDDYYYLTEESTTLKGGSLSDLFARANKEYYFTGWTIEGGEVYTSITFDGAKATTTKQDEKSPWLWLDCGAYLELDPSNTDRVITITANFAKIPTLITKETFDYLQDSEFASVGQGPEIDTAALKTAGYTISAGRVTAHTNVQPSPKSSEYYWNSGYSSSDKPGDAGTYTYTVFIYHGNNTTESVSGDSRSLYVGYYNLPFTISQLNLSASTVSMSDVPPSGAEIARLETEYTYSSLAVCPAPKYLYVRAGNDQYRLHIGDDFTISSKYTNNYNVGTANMSVTNVEGSNFAGTKTLEFTINPIAGGELNVYYGGVSDIYGITTYTGTRYTSDSGESFDQAMKEVYETATDIQSRYGAVYTGYQVRPTVYLVYVWATVLRDVNDTSSHVNVVFPLTMDNSTGSIKDYYGSMPNSEVNPTFYEQTTEQVTGSSGSSPIELFRNNVNACSYSADGENAAYFGITVLSGGNVEGNTELRVYFDIAPLPIGDPDELRSYFDGASVEVAVQEDDPAGTHTTAAEKVFNGGTLSPRVEYVYVTVRGLNINLVSETDGSVSQAKSSSVVYLLILNTSDFTAIAPAAEGTAITSANDGTFTVPKFAVNLHYPALDYPFGAGATSLPGTGAAGYNALFTVEGYYNNVNAHEASGTGAPYVRINAEGNLSGTVDSLFRIAPKPISNENIGFDSNNSTPAVMDAIPNQTYTGSGITPAVWVYVSGNYLNVGGENLLQTRVELISGTDFDIEYSDNVNVTRTATITVSGKGNYTGDASVTFYIVARAVSDSLFTADPLPDVTFTGFAITDHEFDANSTIVLRSASGETFTVPYLKPGTSDPQFEISSTGANTTVADSGRDDSYFVLNFLSTGAGLGANFSGSVTIRFTIAPKNLFGLDAATDYVLYYNGLRHTPTDPGQIHVYDPFNTLVTGGELVNNSDYVLDTSSAAYGDNLDAGEGTLTLNGIGNYKGSLEVGFTINPLNISGSNSGLNPAGINLTLDSVDASGNILDSNGSVIGILSNNRYRYYYRNVQGENIITPSVTGITSNVERMSAADYTVRYGNGSRDNINVLNGGAVVIVGKNNYAGEYVLEFDILAVTQTAVFDTPVADNNGSMLGGDPLGVAAYEIMASAMTSGGIRVTAYTSAISSPYVRGTFTLYNVARNGATPQAVNASNYTVTYEEPNIVTHNGAMMTQTVATITFNTAMTGYFVVTASFTDPNGNFASAEPATSFNYELHGILVKKEDGLANDASFTASWTYGDGEVRLSPRLLSGSGAQATLVSGTGTVLAVTGGSLSGGFTLRVLQAGTATLTVSHNGYVSNLDYSEAYTSFTFSREFSVAQRTLYVYVDGVAEAVYGDTPTFTYAYNGLVAGDEGRVLTGVRNNYDTDAHRNVTPDGGGHLISTVETSEYETGPAAGNYDIRYGSYRDYMAATGEWTTDSEEYLNYYNLVVTKRTLVVTAYNGTNTPGRITRSYGEENPSSVTFEYTGFAYGETSNIFSDAPDFVSPEVVYAYTLGADAIAIDRLTNAGTYNISISSGSSANYEIVGGAQQLVIGKVAPTIYAEYTEVTYDGSAHAIVYSVAGVEGGTKPSGTTSVVYYQDGSTALYTAPRSAGNYSVAIRFAADNDVNYTDSAVVTYTYSEGNTGILDTSVEHIGNALVILARTPEFGYYGGSIELAYSTSGIPLNGLTPNPYGVEGGSSPLGPVTITGFRVHKSGEEYSDAYIPQGSNVAMLTGGVWDIRFDYASTNDDYAGGSGFTLEGLITIAADMVSIEFDGISVEYSGTAVTLTADMFTLTFPDGTITDGAGNKQPNSSGASGGNFAFGTFTFGFVPAGFDGDIEDLISGTAVTSVTDAGVHAVWVYYAASGMEARNTPGTFNSGVNISRKQLSHSDFVLGSGADITAGSFTETFNAASYSWSFGTDIFLRDGVLAERDEQQGGLAGEIRIMFVSAGGETLSSVYNAGTYDIVINYIAAVNDNYQMSSDNIAVGAVEILRAPARIFYDGQTMSVTYNGSGFGISARVEGVGGAAPTGTLLYEYRLSGSGAEWSSAQPVNVGSYDVRVSYVPAVNDNYAAGVPLERTGVIVVNAATPGINIYNIEVAAEDLESFNPIGSALYSVTGAVGDTTPMTEQGKVTVWIGALDAATSSRVWRTYSDWFSGYRSSGTYSVRIVFSSTSANYTDNTQERHNVFVVLNATPVIRLETVTYTYDGSRVSAATAVVSTSDGTVYEPYDGNSSGFVYYGSLNYEYAVEGSDLWTATRPTDVGRYSVRVTYTPNPGRDVFAAASEVFDGAVVIEPMAIYVLPVYGQGQQYAGVNYGGTGLAFMYSYIDNGVVYYVYSEVTDDETGYVYDLSEGQYTDENGNVYTVFTGIDPEGDGSAEQWLDYRESLLGLVSGTFVYGGTEYSVSLDGASSGMIERTAGGIRFVIDLDRDIVYPRYGSDSYTFETETGVYLSYASGSGTAVMKVDTGSSNYVNNADGTATYVTAVNGRMTVIDIDYNTMRALGGSTEYTVALSAGVFSYSAGDNSVVTVYIDFARMTGVDEEGTSAVYRASDGNTYLIDMGMDMAIPVSDLNIDEVLIDGENVSVADMGEGEFANETSYSYYLNGKYYLIDTAARSLREALYYLVTENGGNLILGYGEDVFATASLSMLRATRRDNVYTYEDHASDVVYYIDLEKMIARRADNMSSFDITGTSYAEEFMYVVRDASGAGVGRMPLFGRSHTSSAPGLPGGAFTGSPGLTGAYDAGEYAISVAALSAGDNFTLQRYGDGSYSVKFLVTRVGLDVTFAPPEDLVYDGMAKEVTASLEGLIEGERADIRLEYLSPGGGSNNVDVTEAGFYVRASLVNADGNYYLNNDISDVYFITPANMDMPTYDVSTARVVYDGLAHTIQIVPDEGASVTYMTATRFVEPGTYTIGALITRPNYFDIYFEVTLVIDRAVYNAAPDAYTGELVYGDPLPELTTSSTLGYIALDPEQVLMPGESAYTWTFYPYDPENFYMRYEGAEDGDIRGTIMLNVGKAQADIEIFTELEQTETNPIAIVGSVNGNSLASTEGVTIVYVDSAGNRYSTMPNSAGRYTVVVTYEGDEFYAETVREYILTIEDETNLVWLYYVLGGLTVLTVMSIAFFLMKRGKKFE